MSLKKLKRLRLWNELTQVQLAEQAGVNPATYHNIEQKGYVGNTKTAYKLQRWAYDNGLELRLRDFVKPEYR